VSNINPNPRFVPTPGTPTAAAPPTHAVGGFGVWINHRSMEVVMLAELEDARRAVAREKKAIRQAYKHPPLGPCWGCIDRSVCPFPNDCPRCREMAA
jgi:hypothetical protein